MKPNESNRKQARMKAASTGINLKVVKKKSEKVYFPEKLEQANKIIANTTFRYIK